MLVLRRSPARAGRLLGQSWALALRRSLYLLPVGTLCSPRCTFSCAACRFHICCASVSVVQWPLSAGLGLDYKTRLGRRGNRTGPAPAGDRYELQRAESLSLKHGRRPPRRAYNRALPPATELLADCPLPGTSRRRKIGHIQCDILKRVNAQPPGLAPPLSGCYTRGPPPPQPSTPADELETAHSQSAQQRPVRTRVSQPAQSLRCV